jgi:uncharacterized protein YwgA
MNNWYVVMYFSHGRDDDHQDWNRYYGPYSKEKAEQIVSEINNSQEMKRKYPFYCGGASARQIEVKTSGEILLLLKEEADNFMRG